MQGKKMRIEKSKVILLTILDHSSVTVQLRSRELPLLLKFGHYKFIKKVIMLDALLKYVRFMVYFNCKR